MLKTRIIPCLSLVDDSLVKTVKFDNYKYIGDPINTVRIFNELEVDELCFLDIRATVNGTEPNIALLKQIADECFMPLSYGGGIKTFETAQQIFSAGFEKIVLNTATHRTPQLIQQLSTHYGTQAIIGSVDVKKTIWGKYVVYINDGTEKINIDLIEWVQRLEELGVGELLITSMDKDGTWDGYDVDLIKKVSATVSVPVIANGGAGNLTHIKDAVKKGDASAVGLGSMVVYQKKGMGVLVNFPDKELLQKELQ
jgi:cyclase